MAVNEEEIYSIMFTSLKHPVRRKILRMLADKPMTFTEMAENLGVSTSHLTYHLENLGELIFKMEGGRYRLSSFGAATVTAMKGVEEVPAVEAKRGKLPLKWKTVFGVLLIAVVALSFLSALQFYALDDLASLRAENQRLLAWGVGTNKVSALLQSVVQLDTSKYTVKLLDDTSQFRRDFGVNEELLKYRLTVNQNNMDVDLRFRDNYFSQYKLTPGEDTTIYVTQRIGDIVQIAKTTLENYKIYSGDSYIDEMINLIATVTQPQNVTAGNLKLQITTNGATTEFLWMYSQAGIDFSAKSLRMTFTNKVLVAMTDGYFLFTIGNTNLSITQQRAVQIARDHAKTLTWTIDNKQVTGFDTLETPVAVELLPHPRPNSVALIPYWYVTLQLSQTYPGGINQVAVGLFGDNGEIEDVQMLSR